MWGYDSSDIIEARERELRRGVFKSAIDRGAQMASHNNTPQSAHDIIRTIIRSTERHHPVPLQIQRELANKARDIAETTAGGFICPERGERIRQLREEMQPYLRDMDEQLKQELEEARKSLQERIREVKKDREGTSEGYAAEERRVGARIKAAERGVQKREQDEANHTPARIACVPNSPLSC